MITYLQVENLSKSFGSHVLFQDISFGVEQGDKIGIIAKNGSGKSTLLSILAGREGYDSGKITFHNDISVSYLHQVSDFNPDDSVLEACLNHDTRACNILKRYESALLAGEDITPYIAEMDAADAWDLEDRFKRFLTQAKITEFNKKIGQLSGGQVKRVAIVNALITSPEFILLDEPTNHLDIDMIEWLEDYLSRSKATLLMVTHDRYFLDNVCNKIIELDDDTIYTYQGNYNYYLEKRAERLDQQASATDKARNLYRKELDWMRRQPQARATKAKYRIDAFYDLKERAHRGGADNKIQFAASNEYIGSKIFEADHICKRYGDKVILDDFNYIFSRYDKVGIVGDNGVGKSTFIKMLQGYVAPDAGSFDIGETVKFGYYRQDLEPVDENKKVIDLAREIAEVIYFDERVSLTASQFLTRFLFPPTAQQKYVYKLSGGEKRRLYLALMLMRKPNFIILDEPTNDLDIVTLEILEEYLENFKGCVIIVSHDRFFMDKCVNHLFVFEGNGVVKDFPGNYSEFREWESAHKKAAEDAQVKASPAVKSNNKTRDYSEKLTYKERKEFEQLTVDISTLEEEKSRIEKVFNGVSPLNDGETFDSLSQRFAALKDELDEKELRWLELSEKKE